MVRNIPTYVGMTLTDRRTQSDIWEHPHIRGEDLNGQRRCRNITTSVGKTLKMLSKIKHLTFSKVQNLLTFKASSNRQKFPFYSYVKERSMWNVTLIAQKKEPSKNSTMKDGTPNQCKCVSKPLIWLDAYYGL